MARKIKAKEFVPESIIKLFEGKRLTNDKLDNVAGTLLGNNYVGFRVDPEIKLALLIIEVHTGKGPHEFFKDIIKESLAEKNEALLEQCAEALTDWASNGEYIQAGEIRKMTGFTKAQLPMLQKTLSFPKPTTIGSKEVWRREDVYNWHKKHETK